MFDIAWSEMLVIVVVALVFIGPKDLPRLVREVGRWTAKARSMAREFQRSFDDMVREAELDDIRKGLDQARPSNISRTIRETVDPEGELDRAFHIDEAQRSNPTAPPSPTPPPETPALPGNDAAALPAGDTSATDTTSATVTTAPEVPPAQVIVPPASTAPNGSHPEALTERNQGEPPTEAAHSASAPADSAKV
jgi:sec-independent protein translocase protein TatB